MRLVLERHDQLWSLGRRGVPVLRKLPSGRHAPNRLDNRTGQASVAARLREAIEASLQAHGTEPRSVLRDRLLAELVHASRGDGLGPRSIVFAFKQHADAIDAKITSGQLRSDALSRVRSLVVSAAELSYVPVIEGVASALPIRRESAWIDVRSVLHATWYWSTEIDPIIARALDLVLWDQESDVWSTFPPFERAAELVVHPWVISEFERIRYVERMASVMTEALSHTGEREKAINRLIEPLRAEYADLGASAGAGLSSRPEDDLGIEVVLAARLLIEPDLEMKVRELLGP